jgi:hypothetical protein
MPDIDANRTFRGLPLTAEQDAEVRHYIKKKKQHGEPWDTPELQAMLKDMLEPPPEDDLVDEDSDDETRAAAERASAFIDETMDPIEASEELHAAMEAEVMKGLRRAPEKTTPPAWRGGGSSGQRSTALSACDASTSREADACPASAPSVRLRFCLAPSTRSCGG